MRIICPICQSFSNIEFVWEDTDKYSTTHTQEYKCKCSCAFEVNFKAVETKILNQTKEG